MTDRELLELAAKAAGYDFNRVWHDEQSGILVWEPPIIYESRDWNPLADDGDALRLAVKLRIDVHHSTTMVVAERDTAFDRFEVAVAELKGDDDFSATRRAIVRAAAEIGKAMP
jgi:hypothetical protein